MSCPSEIPAAFKLYLQKRSYDSSNRNVKRCMQEVDEVQYNVYSPSLHMPSGIQLNMGVKRSVWDETACGNSIVVHYVCKGQETLECVKKGICSVK